MVDFTDDEIAAELERQRQATAPGMPGLGPTAPSPSPTFTDDEISDELARQREIDSNPSLKAMLMDRWAKMRLQQEGNRPPFADDYLTATVGPLGQPGLRDAVTRAAVGLTDPNNLDEMTRAFRATYPTGDLKLVPIPQDNNSMEAGSQVLLFRLNPKSPWARFDEPGLTMLDTADLSKFLVDTAGQLAGAKGMGVLAGMAGRVLTPSGVVVGSALGAGGSELGLSGALTLAGIRDEPLPVQIRRAQDAAIMTFLAGGVTHGALQLTRLPPLGGLGVLPGSVTTTPEARAALAAEGALKEEASSLGVKPPINLTAGQLSESPVLERLYRLSSTVSKRVGQITAEQMRRATGLLTAKAITPENQRAFANLTGEMSTATRNWRQRVIDTVSRRAVLPQEGGIAAQDAIEAWRVNSQQLVSTLYDRVDQISPLGFSTAPIREWLADFDAAVQRGAIPRDIAASLQSVVGQLRRTAAQGDVIFDSTLPSGATVKAWKQMDDLRSMAYEASQPNPGEPLRRRFDQTKAREIFDMMNDVMDNPVASTVSETAHWRNALGEARTAARERFDDLDTFHALAQASAYEMDPERFAASLMNNNVSTALPRQVHKMLMDQGMSPRWDAITDGVRGELVARLGENPQSVVKWLDHWRDPAVKRLFLSPEEEASFRLAAKNMSALDRLGWADIVAGDKASAQGVLDTLTRGDPTAIQHILSEPANSRIRQSVRAGLLQRLAEMTKPMASRGTSRNILMPDVDKIDRTITEWERLGADKLLGPGDKEFMRNLWKYVSFTNVGKDPGTSMAATEISSGLVRDFSQHIWDWVRLLVVGRALTTPAARQMIIGWAPGRTFRPANATILLGEITNNLIHQAVRDQPVGRRAHRPIP